jgi:hypothetical protein
MNQWSDEMGNCIRSYSHRQAQGTAVYLGIYKDDKLIANAEIDLAGRKKLTQLLGKYNNHLEEVTRDVLESALVPLGVDVREYWGKPRSFSIAQPDFEFPAVGLAQALPF